MLEEKLLIMAGRYEAAENERRSRLVDLALIFRCPYNGLLSPADSSLNPRG